MKTPAERARELARALAGAVALFEEISADPEAGDESRELARAVLAALRG